MLKAAVAVGGESDSLFALDHAGYVSVIVLLVSRVGVALVPSELIVYSS